MVAPFWTVDQSKGVAVGVGVAVETGVFVLVGLGVIVGGWIVFAGKGGGFVAMTVLVGVWSMLLLSTAVVVGSISVAVPD